MESLKELFKIGPGPSSSHTMGPEKACIYVLNTHKEANNFVVTLFGSLALTGKGHLTDRIIANTLGKTRTKIVFNIKRKTLPHPNYFIIQSFVDDKQIAKTECISIGGGNVIINGNLQNSKNVYSFKNFEEIKCYSLKNNISLPEIVYKFDDSDIKDYLNQIYDVMIDSIHRGLKNTGDLPGILHLKRKASYLQKPNIDNEDDENRHIRVISSYAYAVSEENAAGSIIVTAPTCGSCGVLPATLYYLQTRYNIKREDIIDALAVAGLIGVIFKSNASISGAFAGCQSEIGTACSMASGAANFLKSNSNIETIECAAEIGMEHFLGLTCDPVKGLVQIPCIERNAVAALRSVENASLAMFLESTRKISLDTVINTMYETGKDLNNKYKETSKGGLAKNYKKK